MLKYKLIQIENEKPLLLDNRLSYSDHDIKHILTFIYSQYKRKILILRESYGFKLTSLKQLNIKLVTKKKTYMSLLEKVNKSFNPSMIKELYILFDCGTDSDFNNQEKAHHYLCCAIDNINNDIKLINQIKKSFKDFLRYFNSINLFYDSKAKISLFDLKQYDRGVITDNTREIMYFYFMQLKKTKSRTLNINMAINPFMDSEQLKKLIEKTINHSFKLHLDKILKDNTTILYNNLLNKWL